MLHGEPALLTGSLALLMKCVEMCCGDIRNVKRLTPICSYMYLPGSRPHLEIVMV